MNFVVLVFRNQIDPSRLFIVSFQTVGLHSIAQLNQKSNYKTFRNWYSEHLQKSELVHSNR